jgi:hypothetical protein
VAPLPPEPLKIYAAAQNLLANAAVLSHAPGPELRVWAKNEADFPQNLNLNAVHPVKFAAF